MSRRSRRARERSDRRWGTFWETLCVSIAAALFVGTIASLVIAPSGLTLWELFERIIHA